MWCDQRLKKCLCIWFYFLVCVCYHHEKNTPAKRKRIRDKWNKVIPANPQTCREKQGQWKEPSLDGLNPSQPQTCTLLNAYCHIPLITCASLSGSNAWLICAVRWRDESNTAGVKLLVNSRTRIWMYICLTPKPAFLHITVSQEPHYQEFALRQQFLKRLHACIYLLQFCLKLKKKNVENDVKCPQWEKQ